MPRRARFAFLALLPAVLLKSALASAQMITASGQMFPHRIDVNGNDLGTSTRPQNLMPLGVSYNDCIQDLTLSFDVLVSGFDGGHTLQVWATKSGSCTDPTSRGVGGNAVITCWPLASGLAGAIINTATPETFSIRVQDLVGPQNQTGLMTANYVRQGPEACSAQTGFVAVPMTIYFLAVNSSGGADGTPYMYPIATDLVGPSAPVSAKAGVGDTFLTLNWTPNADSDTTGYDVFLDPIPGQEDVSAYGMDASGIAQNCNNQCTSTVLKGGTVQDSGPGAPTDDAGNPIEGGTVSSGGGGLSTIPSNYIVNANISTGVTVPDKNTGTYTVQGLLNGAPGYSAAVAAVDAFGNVGPPSVEACGCPAVVYDFWSYYRMANGQAGGHCALEAVGKPGAALSGVALLTAAGALARRRKGNRRKRCGP